MPTWPKNSFFCNSYFEALKAKSWWPTTNLASENIFIYLRAFYQYDQKDFAKKKNTKSEMFQRSRKVFFANSAAAIVFQEKVFLPWASSHHR